MSLRDAQEHHRVVSETNYCCEGGGDGGRPTVLQQQRQTAEHHWVEGLHAHLHVQNEKNEKHGRQIVECDDDRKCTRRENDVHPCHGLDRHHYRHEEVQLVSRGLGLLHLDGGGGS